MKLAVTGTMGSGKSTVSRMLAFGLGAELINSDEICRAQLQPGREGVTQLVKSFGGQFCTVDGTVDRDRLRTAVFEDDVVKKRLEDILHPIVAYEINQAYERLERDRRRLVVEVPLLFESDMDKDFDVNVVVKVPRALAVERVYRRDHLEISQIHAIMDSQVAIELKVDMADYVVDNSGTLASTQQQLGWLCRQVRCRLG